jgi:hypothetical protein
MALMDPWTNAIPCCDADFIVEGPWSSVYDSLSVQNKKSAESAASEESTYEWEVIETVKPNVLSKPKQNKLPSPKNTNANQPRPTDAEPPRSSDESPASPESKTIETNSKDEPPPPQPSPYYQPPTVESLMDFNAYDGEILPLPSFDYDHIHQGHNDMLSIAEEAQKHTRKNRLSPKVLASQTPSGTPGTLNRRKKMPAFPSIVESPEEKKDEPNSPKDSQLQSLPQPFYHGIPIFLTSLSQIRVKKVSSHPLGAHVLLISEEALLFSYGLNNHGQLGIGIRSNVKGQNRGFHTTPTLITPLLENGGKAIHCAAGVDHSLVVVATEGRRLHKLQPNPGVAYSDHGAPVFSNPSKRGKPGTNSADDQESVRHHQLYGFGSNDFMKIGLVRARLADDGSEGDGEDILLPRRVALHCTVWPQQADSDNVDDVDDQTLPPQGIFDIAASSEHSAALVRRATGDIEVYMWGNATLGALGLSVSQDLEIEIKGGITQRPSSHANNIFPLPTVLEALTFRPQRESPLGFPRQVSLGPHCSFVVMSSGRCFSFGFSAEGMLAHGLGVTHKMEPKEIAFPSEVSGNNGIVAVKAGAYHAIALTGKGDAYSWGINSDDRLGHGTSELVKLASNPDADDTLKEKMVVIEWSPSKIDLNKAQGGNRTGDAIHCVEACAGYDSSMLVTRSGEVYSFGRRSGRLGKGEIAQNVSLPEPLHGGLRLFHNRTTKGDIPSDLPRPRSKPLLKRIHSDGAFTSKLS